MDCVGWGIAMRRCRKDFLVIVFVGMMLGVTGRAAAESVLNQLTSKANGTLTKTDAGVELRTKSGFEGPSFTKNTFKTPLVMTAEIKTNIGDLRLYFAKGIVTFNSKNKDTNLRTDLRIEDPTTHVPNTFVGKGAFPTDTWVTVKWTISQKSTSVSLDGKVLAVLKGEYSTLKASVGIGTTSHKEVVVVRSLTVTSDDGNPGTAPASNDGSADFEPVDVTISTTPPAPKNDVLEAEKVDSEAVERLAYRNKAKSLLKSLSEVKGMEVMVEADGDARGSAFDIIGTVSADSRESGKAGAGIAVNVGPEMRTCFKEAVRALQLRYPYWEPGHIDVSFEDKYVPHEGGSAGTAFGVLMLSMLEGFEVDPKFAVTGDITVDWKVRTVGGITAKLRGAALDGCTAAAIPEGNEPAFADMRLMQGDASMWNVQVFSIGTLQEAVRLLRTDRDAKITESMHLFDGLRPQLAKSERETLKSAETIKTLNKILDLTPNCLSAKYLLEMAEGNAPRTISASATIYDVVRILYPFRKLLASDQKIDHTSLSLVTMANARKQIGALRPIAPAELLPLLNDAMAYAEAINNVAYNGGTVEAINAKAEIVNSRLAAISSEPGFMDKLVREGY
jgi:hypothetical protein